VRCLDLEPHPLEHIHHRPPRVLTKVGGREIEVAADIVRDRRRLALRARLEHEETPLPCRRSSC
jgi:hypothetical protein